SSRHRSPPPFHCSPSHPHLPSSPTRRSSDLPASPRPAANPSARSASPAAWFPSFVAADSTMWRRSSASRTRHAIAPLGMPSPPLDRKSTRLNSSHEWISYAVFCLKKKKNQQKNFHTNFRILVIKIQNIKRSHFVEIILQKYN